jgi:hypothetical protein
MATNDIPSLEENQMQRIRSSLTYANAMATIAVFLAVGGAGALAATHLGRASVGSAQLKPGAVTGAKVKDGSLTGADVLAASLGKVPSAVHADSATAADRAADAQRAGTAARAETAARADTAKQADSATTARSADIAAALTAPESVHFLDRPGEPRNTGSFQAVTPIGFYRDHEGVVHLQGHLEPTVDNAGPLTDELPPADRPAQIELFFGINPKGSARALVEPTGRIEVISAAKGEIVSLDGLTWRAEEAQEG